MARPRKWRRTTPTPLERERYLAVNGLRPCVGCHRIRPRSAFRDDGTCLWCHDEVTEEVKERIAADKAFVRWYEREFMRRDK